MRAIILPVESRISSDRRNLAEIASAPNEVRPPTTVRTSSLLRCVLAVCAAAAACISPARAEDPAAPFGLTDRVPWTTSRVIGSPDPPPPFTVQRAFNRLKFDEPVCMAEEPGTERFLIAQRKGKIFAFTKGTPDIESMELFLEVKRELYAFSFHPDYEKNGHVFVHSPRDPNEKGENKLSRVSRFRTNLEGTRRCDPASEEIIVEWPSGGHNGGEAIIGPDGYLYVSTGDNSSRSDLNNTGQGVDDLLAVIMRLDVDHPDEGKAYSIPPDNPFIGFPGARPEIWAFGFRNPWRMSFDAQTGGLWVGDVGQDLWEMIWLVQRGGNYGWSVREGTHPFHPEKKIGPGPILPPVIEHHHTECRSITGGYVYYGEKFPELNGVYVYGDYEYGKIWGVRYDGQQVTSHQELANTALRIPTFCVGRDSDIYLMDHPSGELYTLERAPKSEANDDFPRQLSQSGLFLSVPDHELAPGIIPFSVNTAQWLDNAVKQRFVALPGESKITFVERSSDAKTWAFEDGVVLLETISLEMEMGQPETRRRIETRILLKQENHWLGYSYLWNEEQTDARLVAAEGTELDLTIKDPLGENGVRKQTWRVPSRNECMVCHSRAAGFVLGLNTLQMNRDHDYQGVVDNQLRALNHIGIFAEPLEKGPAEYGTLPNAYDPSAELEARTRAYLHVNCSVCHVQNGGGNAKLQLKFEQEMKETQLVDEQPIHGGFGLSEPRVIAPGDPYASVLFYRLSKLGRGRMPHVGSKLIDQRGLDLIHDWIRALDDQQPATQPEPEPHPEYAATRSAFTSALAASALVRSELVTAQLSSTRGAFVLAHLLAQDSPLVSLRREIAAQAMTHPDVDVRDLFERFVPESQRTKRLGETIQPEMILAVNGDVERGRRIFLSDSASQCKNCHQIHGSGGKLGPDLSEIGKKYKPHEILESLIHPSMKIDPKFVSYLVATTQGQVYTGIVLEKSDDELVLSVLKDAKAEIIRVPADDVAELVPQKKSLMPELMLRDMTAQQAADLLAFLMSLKSTTPKPNGR